MKKYILASMIIFLISLTTLVKNTSKNLESEIYNKKESIMLLDRKYNLILLEYNYLSSPEKLFSYSENIKKENYNSIDIINLNKIKIFKDKIEIQKFIGHE